MKKHTKRRTKMGKTIRRNDPHSRKYSKRKQNDIQKTYEKKHQKAEYPRHIWPTDNEKHKGPKI